MNKKEVELINKLMNSTGLDLFKELDKKTYNVSVKNKKDVQTIKINDLLEINVSKDYLKDIDLDQIYFGLITKLVGEELEIDNFSAFRRR